MADVGLRMRPDAGPRTGGAARAPARRGSARVIAGLGAGWRSALALRLRGALGAVFGAVMIASFATYRAADPSFNVASGEAPRNAMGGFGAIVADMGLQTFGLTAWVGALMMIIWGFNRAGAADPRLNRSELRVRAAAGALGMLLLAGVLAMPQPPADWPLARGLGGVFGDALLDGLANIFALARQGDRGAGPRSRTELHNTPAAGRARNAVRLRARRLLALQPPLAVPPCRIADFRYGDLSASDFPILAWRRALNAAGLRHGPRLSYGDARGSASLRNALQGYLWRARGIQCTPDDIVIVNGSQQGLDLCARLLIDPGDRFAIEDPGYVLARHAFLAAGGIAAPVRVDEDGLRTDELPEARLAYVTPSHQYPLGSVLSAPRRRALVAWAVRTGCHVIEDDYDGEYRHDVAPIPPLRTLAPDAVIYVGTFSKTLSPTLRLGYLVVPSGLRRAFGEAKRLTDRHTPTAEQDALADLIASGVYESHVRAIRRRNAERRAVLLAALADELGPTIRIVGAGTGLHVVAWLDDVAADGVPALVAAAQATGVGLHPVSPLYDPDGLGPPVAGFILGYAGLDAGALRRGVTGTLDGRGCAPSKDGRMMVRDRGYTSSRHRVPSLKAIPARGRALRRLVRHGAVERRDLGRGEAEPELGAAPGDVGRRAGPFARHEVVELGLGQRRAVVGAEVGRGGCGSRGCRGPGCRSGGRGGGRGRAGGRASAPGSRPRARRSRRPGSRRPAAPPGPSSRPAGRGPRARGGSGRRAASRVRRACDRW